MRFLYAIGFMILSISLAHAQQPKPTQPTYVPFSVDEDTYKQLQAFLGEQPAKFSMPMLNWLNGSEAKAVSDKAIADKAAAETKKDAPAAPSPTPAPTPPQ